MPGELPDLGLKELEAGVLEFRQALARAPDLWEAYQLGYRHRLETALRPYLPPDKLATTSNTALRRLYREQTGTTLAIEPPDRQKHTEYVTWLKDVVRGLELRVRDLKRRA